MNKYIFILAVGVGVLAAGVVNIHQRTESVQNEWFVHEVDYQAIKYNKGLVWLENASESVLQVEYNYGRQLTIADFELEPTINPYTETNERILR